MKKNEEDEPGDSFEAKRLKTELKNAPKETVEFDLLKEVDTLLSEKSTLNREIKTEEKELKDAVQERILSLSNEEIDQLVYEKWFGKTLNLIVQLVQIPLKNELTTLKMLNERYSMTLSSIEVEINQLEQNFEIMSSDLVVNE